MVANIASVFRPRVSPRETGPIGIDFGLQAMHLVQLEAATGKPARVRACASVAYESRRELLQSPLQFRALIKRALNADRFNGRKAVIAMPSGMFRTVSINYQRPTGGQSEAEAIVEVMKGRLDGDLSNYVLDYLPVKKRSKSDERLAMVAVSEHQPVVDFLELARKAKLDVQALEIGPVAICRLVGALPLSSEDGNVLVINSGRRASYLTLLSGSDLLFDREITFGENSLIDQAAVTLDMSTDMARELVLRTGVHAAGRDDAKSVAIDESGLIGTVAEILKPQFLTLVEEIKRVCLYAAAETRGGSVSQIYLLGSLARWPGSDTLLSSLTGNEVSNIADPLAIFSQAAEDETAKSGTAPEMVVATGAALRGMDRHG